LSETPFQPKAKLLERVGNVVHPHAAAQNLDGFEKAALARVVGADEEVEGAEGNLDVAQAAEIADSQFLDHWVSPPEGDAFASYEGYLAADGLSTAAGQFASEAKGWDN
jgi:hypothetical protein